jgi:hypothetical protein
MRFLADENFPGDAVTALRAAGHDVLWIRTDAPGITDQEVLARGVLECAGRTRFVPGDPNLDAFNAPVPLKVAPTSWCVAGNTRRSFFQKALRSVEMGH